jgi:site-specific DNA-methyltransferase (adenine-specific)
MLLWVFGQGFPKAHKVHADDWAGWYYGGQGLKPACEPIFCGQKPFSEKNGTANVLRWGTGALNIDGCRVGTEILPEQKAGQAQIGTFERYEMVTPERAGRWPANVIHDGSNEVIAVFPESESAPPGNIKPSASTDNVYREYSERSLNGRIDQGSASRFFYSARPDEPSGDRRYTGEGATNFAALPGIRREPVEASRLFYTAKADADDRLGSSHPTVKPLDLIQYLVRLITPKGGLVLDPFAGTGTTGEAAFREGVRAVLIEREPQYLADIERRIKLMLAGPYERERESLKARGKVEPNPGPLFAMK